MPRKPTQKLQLKLVQITLLKLRLIVPKRQPVPLRKPRVRPKLRRAKTRRKLALEIRKRQKPPRSKPRLKNRSKLPKISMKSRIKRQKR